MSSSNGSNTQRGKKKKFLDHFRDLLTVTKAIEATGVARSTIYKWRKEDPEFDAQWNEVDEEITEEIEREAYRRAVEGVPKPLVVGGKIATDEDGKERLIRTYSDRLIEMLLKARRPEKYRERLSIDDDREEMQRRKEAERLSEEEIEERLTGVEDNVVPIRRDAA